MYKRQPLGQRLVEQGLISEEQLSAALTNPVRRRLGRQLLLDGLLDLSLIHIFEQVTVKTWSCDPVIITMVW